MIKVLILSNKNMVIFTSPFTIGTNLNYLLCVEHTYSEFRFLRILNVFQGYGTWNWSNGSTS